MEIVLAFDELGNDLSGYEATSLAREVLLKLHPTWQVTCTPLNRGGRDFAPTFARTYYGQSIPAAVLGPTWEPVSAEIGLLMAEDLPARVCQALRLPPDGPIAIIEAAQACGLHLLPPQERHAAQVSSYGIGQMIARAADDGARAVIIAGGDIAALDLGLGALEAMGLEPVDLDGRLMNRATPSQWEGIARLGGDIWPHIPPLFYLYDYDATLLGPNGAVAQQGRRAGLAPHQLGDYERALGNLAKKLCGAFDQPRSLMAQRGSGDGGGLGFGLQVACDAELIPVADFLPVWQGWRQHWAKADLVVMGCQALNQRTMAQPVFQRALVQAEAFAKPVLVFTEIVEKGLSLPPKLQTHAYVPSGTPRETVDAERRKLLTHKLVNVFKN